MGMVSQAIGGLGNAVSGLGNLGPIGGQNPVADQTQQMANNPIYGQQSPFQPPLGAKPGYDDPMSRPSNSITSFVKPGYDDPGMGNMGLISSGGGKFFGGGAPISGLGNAGPINFNNAQYAPSIGNGAQFAGTDVHGNPIYSQGIFYGGGGEDFFDMNGNQLGSSNPFASNQYSLANRYTKPNLQGLGQLFGVNQSPIPTPGGVLQAAQEALKSQGPAPVSGLGNAGPIGQTGASALRTGVSGLGNAGPIGQGFGQVFGGGGGTGQIGGPAPVSGLGNAGPIVHPGGNVNNRLPTVPMSQPSRPQFTGGLRPAPANYRPPMRRMR